MMVGNINFARVAAYLLVVSCLHPARAATLLPTPININGTSYSEQVTLSEVTLQIYNIIPPVLLGVYYNVRIQLESTQGLAGFYCNPSWGGQPDETNTIAQPKNAVWETDNSQSNNLTISANDPLYLQPNTATSAILSGLPSSANAYQPAFNCSAINPSTAGTAVFTLTVTFDANNRTLSAVEGESLTSIYTSCCTDISSCTSWRNRTQGVAPYRNFCQFAGQYCTPTGRLQKLDLTSFGLKCSFAPASLATFSSLETLILSENPGLTTSLATMMSQLANLPTLRRLELKHSSAISGPLADADPDTSSGLCTAVQNGLQYLDFGNMQLTGSLPSCLLAAPGTLSQLDLSNNNLTGSIPDTIPANSSLFGMALASNSLTGTLPKTLSSASMLSNLDLDNNQLEGSIPADFGTGMSLLSTVDLSKNALTGALPSPVGTSTSLTSLDVSSNQLTALPIEWSEGFANASQSSLLRIFLQQNQIQSRFPAALAGLPQLLMFNASDNRLSGALPSVSGMFSQTQALEVSSNLLIGPIPPEFSSVGALNKSLADVLVTPNTPLQRVLDLANNNLTGGVPVFLEKSAVPAMLKISLVGNRLIADCGSTSFSYLDMCDQVLNSSNIAAAPLPVPSSVPAELTAATPVAVVQPVAATPPANASQVASQSGGVAAASTKSGIGSGAIAGIVVGALVAVAVAAAATVMYLKRQRSHKRSLLRMQSSGAFSRFEDF
ncbi:hypothetical protein ABBQ32_008648 [Trebouxia sp. C0010 RCD-2024]